MEEIYPLPQAKAYPLWKIICKEVYKEKIQ